MANPTVFSTLVTGPAAPLLTTDEAKEQVVAVGFSDDDSLIDRYVAAASGYLDAEHGILGRALVTQTWRVTFSGTPASRTLSLPFPRLQSVSSVTYYDLDGVEQTFGASNYRVISPDHGGFIELVDGASWPAVASRSDAMSVEFVAGYGDAGSDVPAPIRQAAALLAGLWYKEREAATDTAFSALPMGVQSLLQPFRLAGGLF